MQRDILCDVQKKTNLDTNNVSCVQAERQNQSVCGETKFNEAVANG